MGRCDGELKSGETLTKRTMLLGCGRRLACRVVRGLIGGPCPLMTGGDLCAASRFPEKRRGRLRNHMEGNESRIKYSADERERPGNAAVSVEDPNPHGMSLAGAKYWLKPYFRPKERQSAGRRIG